MERARPFPGLPLAHPRASALIAGALTVLAFAPFDLFWLPPDPGPVGPADAEPTPGQAWAWAGCSGWASRGGVSGLHISIDQFGNVGTPSAMLFTLAFILAMALYFGLVGWLLGRLGAGLPWPWWLLLLPAA